jgi:hypothetical protein
MYSHNILNVKTNAFFVTPYSHLMVVLQETFTLISE